MHGDRVHHEYLAGNLQKIRDYCETDVLNTYGIYLHFEHMRGTLSSTEHQQALATLAHYLEAENHKPHFAEFLDHWQR
jgi:3'-5' exonuclease